MRLCAKKLKSIMEAAYNELLETDITATPPIHINTPKKVKSPIAKEIQKLRKSGSSDSKIIELSPGYRQSYKAANTEK